MASASPLNLDLAKCFAGEQQLITWQLVYDALARPEEAAQRPSLRAFLTAEPTLALLSRPWEPFAKASAQERQQFDAATAPIQITTSVANHYNLTEIKDDALWLSKQAGISEYEALKLVLEEWQNRPRKKLLNGLSEEEILSVQEATGHQSIDPSSHALTSSVLVTPTTSGPATAADADQCEVRRLRILEVYWSACTAILRVSQLLVAWGCAKELSEHLHEWQYEITRTWLGQLGRDIASNQNRKEGASTVAAGFDKCVRATKARLESLEAGCTWDIPETMQVQMSSLWITGLTAQIMHVLHLAFLQADVIIDGYLPATSIEQWFTTISEGGFLRDFPLQTAQQQRFVPTIQTLVSLISISVLRINAVFDDLESGAFNSWDASHYLLDGGVLERLTGCFLSAVQLDASPATPPAFVWSVLTCRLAAYGQTLENERERSIEDLADSRRSMPGPSLLEEASTVIRAFDGDGKPLFQELAEICSAQSVLRLSAQLLAVGQAGFGDKIDQVSCIRFRFQFAHMLRVALGAGILEYSPDVVMLAHAILINGSSSEPFHWKNGHRPADPVVSFFLADAVILRPALLEESRLRYPYEYVPFLKLFSALAQGGEVSSDGVPVILDQILHMSTFMQRLPAGFVEYHLEHEEDNVNQVSLSVDLPQFVKTGMQRVPARGRPFPSKGHDTNQHVSVIEVGARGTIVDDRAQPFIAAWIHSHSAIDYLVQLLSTYTVGNDKVESSTMQPASVDEATEIIAFFTVLIQASLQASHSDSGLGVCAPELLTALDMSAEHNQDTIAIILEIFDEELLRLCQNPANDASLELLVTCSQFFQALVITAPNRAWPWLVKSHLLEHDSSESSLATILIGTELVVGRYEFLIECIGMFNGLVEDAVTRSVSRLSSDRALTRFKATTNLMSGASEKTMASTLLIFTQILVSIFESSLDWRYSRAEDRANISIGICEAFTTILQASYGIDDSPDLTHKITKLVAPAARYITSIYLTPASGAYPINPIIASFLSGIDPARNTLSTTITASLEHQTRSAIVFAITLVRVSLLVNIPWSSLEQQLFKATPVLVRLYAINDLWKPLVSRLLESLVRGASRIPPIEQIRDATSFKKDRAEPPSVLGHLGTVPALNFLRVLSSLDEPLGSVDIQQRLWDLFSAVVTCKQRWFSLYLLTGSTPRQRMTSKSGAADGKTDQALLTRALALFSARDLESTESTWPVAIAMLKFITAAFNDWSWVTGSLDVRKDFTKQILGFLTWLARQPRELKTDAAVLLRTYQNTCASLISELLAMYLHNTRHSGDPAILREILPALNYFQDTALRIPSYNNSLHTNLKQNIEQKFPSITLAKFKNTSLFPASIGQDFFYDLRLADELLGFDSKWSGPRSGQGFKGEVIKANLNLGLVDSQIQLLESWKVLATQLSLTALQDEHVQRLSTRTIKECMEINAQSAMSEVLFGELLVSRADLAYTLLKGLAGTKCAMPETRQLLGPVWRSIRASTPDFDTVFSSGEVDYHRSLLRIMYLALQFHEVNESDKDHFEAQSLRSSFRGGVPKSRSEVHEPISNVLLQILGDTVVKGFRSLATQLHAEPGSVQPSDFALLTALLQRIIAVPEMAKWQQQAALLFANSNTMRYATSLFSWCDKLTVQNNGVDDPIYGELSLLFILTLSSLPSLAETMAVEGILSQLNTANLLQYFQRPHGMGPFDKPARLHSIWTKGLLPLCLNLLLSVGAPIAGEISSFLNQFPNQLARSSNALNSRNADRITLAVASETHSLALLWSIIDEMRKQGPRLGIQAAEVPLLDWDAAGVKEDVEGWLTRKTALRERVLHDGSDGVEDKVVREIEAAGACLGLGNT